MEADSEPDRDVGTVQPVPVESGQSRVLGWLSADVRSAREQVAASRATTAVNGQLAAARQWLLRALEAYAAALTERRLPVPPRLRDELRLLRRTGRG